MLLTTYPYVLWATAGFGLFVLVGVSSVRAARRRLSYETWYGLHLYAYLAIALAFLHQLFVGADFMHDQLAAIYWIGLYVVTAALVLTFRVGQPLVTSLRHRLRVAAIVDEAPGVVSVYLTGRDLDRLAVRSGQYFIIRFLTRDGWWRAHPFSISSAPERPLAPLHGQGPGRRQPADPRDPGRDAGLRRGPVRHPHRRPADAARRDADRRRHRDHAAPGAARVAAGRARRPHADLPRERPADQLVFRTELDTLAAHRGAQVHYLVGSRRAGDPGRPWPARRSTPPRWRGWCPRSPSRTSTCAGRRG